MKPRHPYREVIGVVVSVWAVPFFGILAFRIFYWDELMTPGGPLAIFVALGIASVLIAVLSATPGWFIELPLPTESTPSESAQPESAQAQPPETEVLLGPVVRIGNAFLVGMMIRLPGTVALFVASSYYMEASPTRLAGWILGWHWLFLAAETVWIFCLMPPDSA